MKKIQTENFKKIKADLIEHPPLFYEEEQVPLKNKKKKKIYQLGIEVDDVSIDDFESRG